VLLTFGVLFGIDLTYVATIVEWFLTVQFLLRLSHLLARLPEVVKSGIDYRNCAIVQS